MPPTEDVLPCSVCGADPGSTLVCQACGAITAEPPGSNHYTRLGLSALAPWDPDAAELRHLQLSRLLHPDFQAGADEQTRELALAHSALLNEAYAVLQDEQLRHEYLLELHYPGCLEEHKQLDPMFLMEAMELSEELEDARSRGCQDTVHRIAELARQQIDERMAGVATTCATTMQRIADAPSVVDPDAEAPAHPPARPATAWNCQEIATLLHQARVYRRILRDTEAHA